MTMDEMYGEIIVMLRHYNIKCYYSPSVSGEKSC